MATDLDEDEDLQRGATSRSPDPAQQHYDQEFDALTGPEHYGRDAEEPEGLRDAEENPNDDSEEEGPQYGPLTELQQKQRNREERYNKKRQERVAKREGRLKSRFSSGSRTKKKWAIAGAIGGGSIIASVLIFIALLPLKIEHMISNIDQYFGAQTAQAIDTETEELFSAYITRQVLPGIQNGRCRSTAEPGCVGAVSGSGPVSLLFTAWKDGRLEQKMATKYGIIVGSKGNGNALFLNVEGHDYNMKSGDDIFKLSGTKEADRKAIRAAVKNALKDASLYDRTFTRFKYTALLARKHAIRRCTIACDTNDKFTEKYADKKLAAKAYIFNRVIGPYSESKALIITCILSGSCDTNPNQRTDDPNYRERISPFNRDLRQKLADYTAAHSAEKLADLVASANAASREGGVGKYITKQVANAIIDKIGVGGDAAKAVSGQAVDKFIPIAGWAIFATSIIHFMDKAPEQLKALNYAASSTAAVSTYTSFKTVADEVHSGHMDATELGSFTDQLSNGSVDATSTPLYNDVVNGSSGSTTTASLISSASADPIVATTTAPPSSSYLCADNNPVPAGQKVCDEENFSGGNAVISAISDKVKNIPGWSALVAIAEPLHAVANALSSFVGGLFSHIPGYDYVTGKLAELAGPLIKALTTILLPNILADSVTNGQTTSGSTSLLSTPKASADSTDGSLLPGGGRTFDLIAGGSDVAQNESCQIQLGCAQISDQQVAAVRSSQLAEQKKAFESESFFARMFDTSSSYSMISRIALAMPSSLGSSVQALFGSLLQNPFSTMSHAFGSIFSSDRAFAAPTPRPDPFGVVQTGYTDAQIPSNPDIYWDQHCQAFADNPADANGWLDSQVADKDTGEAVAKTPNPCLLIQASIQSAGGVFDSSLLPSDSSNDSGFNNGSSAPSSPGTYRNPLRDVKNLGQSRVDQGVDYTGSGPVYAIGNGVVKNITNAGWPGGTFIVYQLTDGPAKDKYVFFAENCSPIQVSIGQTVDTNTVLCTMIDASPHIEIGWANGAALGEALAHDVWVGYDSDAYFTAYGQNFSQLMVSLSAPSGKIAPGAKMLGSLPPGWPTWQ